jgi:hypothetical protein
MINNEIVVLIEKHCLFCDKKYLSVTKGFGQKKIYCSKRCREKYFNLINPDKLRIYRHTDYLKYHKKFCKFCGDEIINRTNNNVFCDSICRHEKQLITQKIWKHKIFELYSNFKKDCGCALCGYNKNGACLDYHHILNKKFRVDAILFYYMTERTYNEFLKCILLCKNCHYELHNKFT